MLTWWALAERDTCTARHTTALTILLITEDNDLPSVEVVSESQKRNPPAENSEFTLNQTDGCDLWKNNTGQQYIPTEDTELQVRLCMEAHCGLGGNRGSTATKPIIREKVRWATIEAHVNSFCQDCFACIISASCLKVRRPLGHQQHVEKVGELLTFLLSVPRGILVWPRVHPNTERIIFRLCLPTTL